MKCDWWFPPARGGGRFYFNFTGFPFPLGPFLHRRTTRYEDVKDIIWLFEQEQALGFSSVSTNTRMTVIKLKSGWVIGPCPDQRVHPGMGRISEMELAPELAPRDFRAKTLKDEDLLAPWADEIEQKIVSSPKVGIGPYVEVAFHHKRTSTLLVTDAVIYVPRQPSDCISKDSLLSSAKNGLAVKILSKGKEVPEEPVVDNEMNRQKGMSSTLKKDNFAI